MGSRVDWLRVIITFTLSVLVIFLPIRQLKMNRIFKRVPRYERGSRAGTMNAAYHTNREANLEQRVRTESCIRLRTGMSERLGGSVRASPSNTTSSSSSTTTTTTTSGSTSGNQYQRQQGRPRASNLIYEYELIAADSSLAPMETFLNSYYKYLICYNWWLLAKHLVVCILRLDSLAHLRYLDCYLIGRFIVNGRVIELACYCACFLVTYKLAWFYSVKRKYYGDFKLSCFEFMLLGYEEVVRQARRSSTRESTKSENTFREEDEDFNRLKSDELESERLHWTIFEFRNAFDLNEHHTKSYGLRPNRTPDSWLDLTCVTLRYYKVSVLLFAFLVVFFLAMLLPVTLNQKGFEYNYRYCIHYITTERIKASQDPGYPEPNWASSYFFSLIRHNQDELGGTLGKVFLFNRPNVTKNFRLSSMMSEDFLQPIKNVVHMNSYHATRIFFDIIDSSVIYFQIAFVLNCACYMVILLCRDIVHYCSALNARLSSLIVVLRSTSTISLGVPDNYYYHTSIKFNDRLADPNTRPGPPPITSSMNINPKHIRVDIHEIQAMIADMFNMIDSYNKYISYQMICLNLFWLGYSAMVSSWMFIPGHDSPKTEWYTVHVFATIYVFICMHQFSRVKRECRYLYSQIVIAMALDEFNGSSKVAWTSLLKFYTPVPMFCFTIINSIELNLMFGLKMLAWLFSALIVASSFFTVYRID